MRTSTGKSSLVVICKSQYVEAGELARMTKDGPCDNCRDNKRHMPERDQKMLIVATSVVQFVGKEEAQAELAKTR